MAVFHQSYSCTGPYVCLCVCVYIYMVFISVAYISKHRQDFCFQEAVENKQEQKNILW